MLLLPPPLGVTVAEDAGAIAGGDSAPVSPPRPSSKFMVTPSVVAAAVEVGSNGIGGGSLSVSASGADALRAGGCDGFLDCPVVSMVYK